MSESQVRNALTRLQELNTELSKIMMETHQMISEMVREEPLNQAVTPAEALLEMRIKQLVDLRVSEIETRMSEAVDRIHMTPGGSRDESFIALFRAIQKAVKKP